MARRIILAIALLISLVACQPRYGENTCYVVDDHFTGPMEVPCQ